MFFLKSLIDSICMNLLSTINLEEATTKDPENPLAWRSFDFNICYEIIKFVEKLCLANGYLSFLKTNTHQVNV
jgi:hypothetical protein